MIELKLNAGIWLLMASFLSIQGCSRTAISLEGRNDQNGERVSKRRSASTDAGAVVQEGGISPEPSFDGGTDGGTEPEIFRVTVYDEDRPQAGVDVVFHNAQGQFEHFVRTPANGTAEYRINPGTMLTVVVPPDPEDEEPEYAAFTYTGLKPGEHIHVGKRSPKLDHEDYSVTLILENKPSGVRGVTLDFGCEEPLEELSEDNIEITVTPDCFANDGIFNALIRTESWGGGESWFAYIVDQRLDKDSENLFVIREWSRGERDFSVDLSQFPNDAAGLYLEMQLQRGAKRYRSHAIQRGITQSADLSLRIPEGFADALFYRTALLFVQGNDFDGYSLYESPASLDDLSIRLSADDEFLGRITDVETNIEWASNRPIITWSEFDSPLDPYVRYAIIRIRAGFRTIRWTAILAPEVRSEFEFPEVPPEIEGFEGIENVEITGHQVLSFESSFIEGFDELRREFGITAVQERRRRQAKSRFSVGGDLDL